MNGRARCKPLAAKERSVPEQAEVQFGREICGDLVAAGSREWLVTNGIGGYASGTVAGSQTRRYHGVLIAALQPPVGRTQLVSNIDEIVHYAGSDFFLATHRWASGAVDPQGFLLLEDFHLEGSTPVWTYALADALVEKRVWMRQGENTTFIQYTLVRGSAALDIETARAERPNYEVKLFHDWQAKNEALSEEAPTWLWQLILAADQFIVKRSLPEEPDGRSIIAGYHWFGDWGRDTMIALPGLTLATGRTAVARQILLAFSRYVDGGMLPNNFPDIGGQPEYNTVDAALWYIESVRQYFEATQDAVTLQKLFPVLAAMIEAHIAGTRYSIHADPADGLLYAAGPGVQLTWMDAKIGDWVVTPRTGKPVEINALWINALETMGGFARVLAKPSDAY